MKITDYFINHPISAVVLNCMIGVLGILCFYNLTIREYPNISFPIITVRTAYPNASPQLIETSVTNILEEQLAGIEGLDTITSSSNAGNSQIKLLFRGGTSLDKALNAVQDGVERAKPFLPSAVKAPPMIERQKSTSGLPFIGISLESDSQGFGELTHYANLNFKNIFRTIPGVSSVEIWGEPYTYMIKLDPQKLFAFGVNVDEVVDALGKNNITYPAGRYQNKIPTSLNFQLRTKEDYEHLVIKANTGHPIFLKSVAEVNLENDDTSERIRVNGHPGVLIAINRANDANPIEVSQHVQHILKELKHNLSPDLKMHVLVDQSDFINASIKNIRSAIGEAIALVLIIVFLFLRHLRTTLIPLLTIPISLLGSLILLKLFGFSLNLMTLLAMVLAIGLVVDDAIIVLENIWRHMEKGHAAYAAALLGAREIGFAIVAMTCTLASVYLPLAFIQGLLGQLFIEFAVALVGCIFVSGIVALTLSPLMCAYLLQPHTNNWWPQFDHGLAKLTQKYQSALRFILQHQKIALFIALISISVSIGFYHLIPMKLPPKKTEG